MKNGLRILVVLLMLILTVTPILASELESIDAELDENESAQEEIEKTIEEYEAEIEELAAEINALQEDLDEEYELMKLRIQAFYENFGNNFMDAVTESGTISEVLTDIDTSLELTSYDRNKLEEIEVLSTELEEKQEEMLTLLDDAYAEQEALIEEQEDLEEAYEKAYEEAQEEATKASVSVSDLDLLAALIYCEAGGEIYEGQVAVGCVVINRMNSSRYPNTLSGVIYQSGQFSPVASGRLATVLANGIATSSCYKAAEYVLSGNNSYPNFLSFRAASCSLSGVNYTQIGNQKFF